MGLGAALFGLGIFHGFAQGSCSSTGYSQHYGPEPHCASGAVWWMLLLTGGIFVALGGAALFRDGKHDPRPGDVRRDRRAVHCAGSR